MTPWAETMADRQAAGLCRQCGKPQAPGCALCELHRDKERERRKAKYYARKNAGLCIEGGCGRKPAGGHIRCRTCHAHFLALGKAWQRVHRVKGKPRPHPPAPPSR